MDLPVGNLHKFHLLFVFRYLARFPSPTYTITTFALMSTTVKANNLFMNQVKTPSDDLGILDLGKHCFKCNELDFLPFHCEFCNHTYCSNHRSLELHNCVGRSEKIHVSRQYDGPSAASLFPDRAAHNRQLDALLKPPKPTSIGLAEARKLNPLMKLTKFLHLQRELRKLSKLLLLRKTKPSKVAETISIKKCAKGAASVGATDRVYVWVLYINRNEDELDKINLEKDRKGVWVLKSWKIGRALDLISDVLGIMNHNNLTQKTQERLNLFHVKDETPFALDTSKKVSAVLSSGDTVYLVKGDME